jgi:hypothetical protein
VDVQETNFDKILMGGWGSPNLNTIANSMPHAPSAVREYYEKICENPVRKPLKRKPVVTRAIIG